VFREWWGLSVTVLWMCQHISVAGSIVHAYLGSIGLGNLGGTRPTITNATDGQIMILNYGHEHTVAYTKFSLVTEFSRPQHSTITNGGIRLNFPVTEAYNVSIETVTFCPGIYVCGLDGNGTSKGGPPSKSVGAPLFTYHTNLIVD